MIPFVPKLVKKFGKKELSGFGAFFSALAAIACYIIKPVSYTHLDVYKRQVQIFFRKLVIKQKNIDTKRKL